MAKSGGGGKYLIILAILFGTLFVSLALASKKLTKWADWAARDYEVSSEPCDLMDPIRLKIGEAIVSYPARYDFNIYQSDELPKYPRRVVRTGELRGAYQVCVEGKDFHEVTGVSVRASSYKHLSPAESALRGTTSGFFYRAPDQVPPSHRKLTGYKSDTAHCYTSDVGHESCKLYRQLPDLSAYISASLTTTDINAYGKPVPEDMRRARGEWPQTMDDLEAVWRSFLVDALVDEP